MAMTPAGLKTAILTALTGSGVVIEDDGPIEKLAEAIVEYIQANATVTGITVDVSTGTQILPGSVN